MELWRTIRTKVKAHDMHARVKVIFLDLQVHTEECIYFVCLCFSQEAGWGCCHGDATPEECRGRGGRGQREKEDQCSKEREECLAGQAHQTGGSNWQSRQGLLYTIWAGLTLL